MYDSGKIITGLIIFLVLITFPTWYNLVQGKASYVPELKIVTKEKECIEPTPYMRANHTELLTLWRESVVREGDRVYVGAGGKKYIMSLQNTCMNCHSNKTEFCDRCHNYSAVTPNCWDCHIAPKEKT
ncbi:MAG: sulfate reduction electron transfer complex DsrMKJOP subunit DsrJ [Deltaproteobacteria bacterium]|nr:sulfate reduction electron transfer complex DsrMKJOP subunit DsrJ [Deltaproteobacteria bacterium]MBW2305910.1 sulfate reduction electron transfer complex DsrMKJOP subunit DsrJ [Deltaproteobacteria bacterium]